MLHQISGCEYYTKPERQNMPLNLSCLRLFLSNLIIIAPTFFKKADMFHDESQKETCLNVRQKIQYMQNIHADLCLIFNS